METELICISCPKGCALKVSESKGVIGVRGNKCRRGAEYAVGELTDPRRVLTTTVMVDSGCHPLLPVRTSTAIPKRLLGEVIERLRQVVVTAPVKRGEVIVPNIMQTGIDIIASRDLKRLRP